MIEREQTMKNYHDWYLTSVTTDIERYGLELRFVKDRQSSTVSFLGVRKCIVDNFTIGNIVLDVECFSGESSVESLLTDTAFKGLFYLPGEMSNFQKMIDELRQGLLTYVEIQPSYGCDVRIICEEIKEV